MKFWVLGKFTIPPGFPSAIPPDFPLWEGAFYRAMFHGEMYRAGRPAVQYPWDLSVEDPYTVEELLRHPPELVRNAYGIPPVFMPMSNLVLSQQVREALGEHERLHYSRATFRHLFWLPWRLGEADLVAISHLTQGLP